MTRRMIISRLGALVLFHFSMGAGVRGGVFAGCDVIALSTCGNIRIMLYWQ